MHFTGLPSPAGAAAIASYAFMFYALGDSETNLRIAAEWFLPIFAVLVALLMVSRISYPHLTSHLLHGEQSFRHLVMVLFAATTVLAVPWYSLPILCTSFALFGPMRLAWNYLTAGDEAQEQPMF